MIFHLEARQLGTNSDLALELYSEREDGGLELIEVTDNYWSGAGETESLTLDLKTGQSGLGSGMYYLRVRSADAALFGSGSEYELRIYVPTGGSGGVILLGGTGGGLLTLGAFYVALGPPQALAAGGGWQVSELGETGYRSDGALYALPILPLPARYHLAFRPIPGFAAPTNRVLPLIDSATASVLAYYVYTNLSPRVERAAAASNGVFGITYLGRAGRRYAIEQSADLADWTPLRTNQIPQDGLLRFSATNAPAQQRAFFRARLVP